MAIRSLLSNLRSINAVCNAISRRQLYSTAIPVSTSDDLRVRVLKLIFPRRSATILLQNWVDEGHKVSIHELRRISKQLISYRRYKHALEVMTWMEAQNKFQMSSTDHAMILELIIKTQTTKEAEEYFSNIPNPSLQKAAYLPLLHSFVKERSTDKAESLMLKMSNMGFTLSPHPYNEMMKLYIATSQFDKVPLVIKQMEQNKIPKNVLSYNLWMSSCFEVSGVPLAETVYKEMVRDKRVEVGWSSLSTLANIYIKSGLVDKATLALKNAENKLSMHNRLGYLFLITLYTSLKNKGEVLRLWELCKQAEGNLTCANYMCILLCLVKLKDIKEAERIFIEWESQCRKYDIRVSNILLGAYTRNGLMEKAEDLHKRTLERGGHPNYKTWEILMEGWMKIGNMNRAINAMKIGFGMLKHCEWRPSDNFVAEISGHFEKSGDFEEMRRFFKVVRHLGVVSLVVYKVLIRMCIRNQRPIDDVVKMMKKDEIDMDDETLTLVEINS